MAKVDQREALEVLTRARLIELAQGFELEVTTRSSKDELIDVLARSKRASYEAILEVLSRKELKEICRAHGLSDKGKEKAGIIARILGRVEDAEEDEQLALAVEAEAVEEDEEVAAPSERKKARGRPRARSGGDSDAGNGSGSASAGNGGVLGFESQLWSMADQLWTNSALQPSEYSTPVLALIFLKYADHKFAQAEAKLQESQRRRRAVSKDDFLAEGVLYVPEEARFGRLLEMPEGEDVGAAVNEAMKAIERENTELKDVLPKTYAKFEKATLKSLLKIFGGIPKEASGDVFGRVYEYFLGKFAPKTLQKGGEYFTPESVVKLIVEIVEPFHGRILDPACGSGGMFIQSARFVAEHRKNPSEEISIHGVEKIGQTLRLAKMSLAVHGLSGELREANSYYEDPFDCVGKFDFVMANPPFNQGAVDKERIKDDKRRFPFGMPNTDNANYLWIQLFYSALNEKGRAGFVMANSASDARGSERNIAEQVIQTGAIDVIVTLDTNFFYTVSLPVTLWFLDRAKPATARKDTVLMLDARGIFRQVTRVHRDFSPEQCEFLANVVRLYRGGPIENRHGGARTTEARVGSGYRDVPGLCRVVSFADIKEADWSLNPGRYVGVADVRVDAGDLMGRLREASEQLCRLNKEAVVLEARIQSTLIELLGTR